jgi:hypothetical protein
VPKPGAVGINIGFKQEFDTEAFALVDTTVISHITNVGNEAGLDTHAILV